MSNKRVILWDFDGVIMNSNHIRDLGFQLVLDGFPKDEINELMIYHQENGGLSRFHKFRYFFENIRNEEVSSEQIDLLAAKFSKIMIDSLIDESLLISETIEFIEKNHKNYNMHIVSGSAEVELKHICESLNISKFFTSINGSPVHKNELVKRLIKNISYDQASFLLIGDSINDYNAAIVNNIDFMAYGTTDNNLLSKSSVIFPLT